MSEMYIGGAQVKLNSFLTSALDDCSEEIQVLGILPSEKWSPSLIAEGAHCFPILTET
jgi:hypothetical protein